MTTPSAPNGANTQPLVLPPLDTLVEKYRELRDRKKALSEEQATALKPYTEAMNKLEALLLAHLNEVGANSIATGKGTFFKTTRVSYSIADPAALRAYIETHGLTDIYENRVSKSAVDNLLERGAPLPDGIAVSSFTSVNIHKPS